MDLGPQTEALREVGPHLDAAPLPGTLLGRRLFGLLRHFVAATLLLVADLADLAVPTAILEVPRRDGEWNRKGEVGKGTCGGVGCWDRSESCRL